MISDQILVWVVIKLISDFFWKSLDSAQTGRTWIFLGVNTGSHRNKSTCRDYFGTSCSLVISQVSQSDDNTMATV